VVAGNQKKVKTIARFWIKKCKIQKRILWFRRISPLGLQVAKVVDSKSSLLILITLFKGV
jgi:hypothetical protein